MAQNLGFTPQVIGYLTEKVDQNPRIAPDWNIIMHNINKYLADDLTN